MASAPEDAAAKTAVPNGGALGEGKNAEGSAAGVQSPQPKVTNATAVSGCRGQENGSVAQPVAPTPWELYTHVREEIAREWTQITSRIGWLVTSQAFLFAVLTGWGLASSPLSKNPLLPLVPLIGIAASLAIAGAVWAALRRIRTLRAYQRRLLGSLAADSGGTDSDLAPSSSPIHVIGAFPTYVIPVSLFLGWIHVLGIAGMACIAGLTFDPNQGSSHYFHIVAGLVFGCVWLIVVWE